MKFTQNIADGASLAGARTLGHTYQGLTYEQQQGFYCDDDCQLAIRTAAQEVGTNSVAALAFDDRKSAREVLTALDAEESVIGACLYDTEGRPFASRARSTVATISPKS